MGKNFFSENIKPGHWLLIKYTVEFGNSKINDYFFNVVFKDIKKSHVKIKIIIRTILNDLPVAEYSKKIFTNDKNIAHELFPDLKDYFLNFSHKNIKNAGEETIKVGEKKFNCKIISKRFTRGGGIIKNWISQSSHLLFPVKISKVDKKGVEKVVFSIEKTGDGKSKLPGGKNKFETEYYSPDAKYSIFNEEQFLNYNSCLMELLKRNSSSLNKTILDTKNKIDIEFNSMIDDFTGSRVIYVGEVHDSAESHNMQLKIIKEMFTKNRDFVIGLEMFYRTGDIQQGMDDYVYGKINEKEFAEKIYRPCWSDDWYRLYRKIFTFARKNKIRMIGLNCPRQLMRDFRKNPRSLTPLMRSWFAESIDYKNRLHKKISMWNFESMANMGMDTEALYPGQCIWDDTMSESIANYFKKNKKSQMVVLVGSLHVAYRVTIPERARKKALTNGMDLNYKIIIPHEMNEFIVSEFNELMRLDIADYVYFTPLKVVKFDSDIISDEIEGGDEIDDEGLSWMEGLNLFNEGKIDEAENSLKHDDSDIGEKILARIKTFRNAKKIALNGNSKNAKSMIKEIDEVYEEAKKIWLKKIAVTEKTGKWPE